MRIIRRKKLDLACRAIIEAMESRLLLSAGLLSTNEDIGSPGQPGSASYSNGVYTIIGGGAGVGGNSDQFNFAFENVSGNATIVAKLNSLTNASGSAESGIMIRDNDSTVSAFAAIYITAGNQVTFASRTTDGGTAGGSTTGGVHAPEYLELTLSGSTVSGFYSSNGLTWTSAGSAQTITLGTSALVGLETSSANNASTTTGSFSSVSVLPGGWSDNDIGSPPLPGSAGYNSVANTFTLSGSGSGIGGSSDQFNFANYSVTGDTSVSTLVDSVTNTNPSAAAGVMIRADSTATSLFAGVELTAQNTVEFAGRSGSGVFTSSAVTVTSPVWLKLTDIGNNFSGYYSTDDVNWTQLGTTQAIAMPSATALAGVWASSSNNSALNTSVFSDVSLVRGGWNDNDIGSPAFGGSAVYDAPSDTYTINGNGSDIWGNADQFNFASTTMTGDGSAIAYVDSITNTDAWAKAGVMIRNDSTAGSVFAALLVSPTNGITFEWRSTAGGATSQEVNVSISAPVGLKLTRAGSTFTAYYSTDGITWIAIGPSQAVTMNATALAGLAVTSHNTGAICTATFSSVSIGNSSPPGAGIYSATDQLFLNDLENREVLSFYNEATASSGLVPDSNNANGGGASSDSSIAADGFDLSALTIGDARGWLSHANAYQRALTTINFLYNSGANQNGFFYHFLNPTTGARFGGSEVSSVDTAELMAGVLNVAQYWAGTPLQTTAMQLYDRVNWPWMQQSNGVFYGAWTPESGFSGGYGDFSEAVVLYLLGLGSPTHPSSQASWLSWSRSPLETYSGYTFITADDAALFTEQYPQAWFNLQGLTDSKGLNYYTNSQTATLAQRQFMINLSSTYSDYGPNMWGLTPSEGINGYTVWGGPPANGPIDGTVVPTAPGGSLEFDPRLTANALEYMKQTYGGTVYKKYGFVDAFNPLKNWTSQLVLGIDIGMTLISAENSRSNLVWNTFNQNSAAQQAISKAFPSHTGPSVWQSTSGNWNTAANWTNGTIPNAVGAEADLFGSISSPQTIFTNVGVTAGIVHFNNASEYVIAGAGSLTLQASSGNAVVEVDQGTDVIDLPMTLASNTTFNVATGATLVIGGTLTINSGVTLTQIGGGTVIYQSIVTVASSGSIAFAESTYVPQLSLAAGATASLNGVGTVLELNSLPSTGTIDVNNNTLLINYGSSADPIASVRAMLASGYAGGAWNGVGINSSAAAAASNGKYGVGYADGADGVVAGLASGQIEIMYTLNGDANLDGVVNGSDFAILSSNFNKAVGGWDQGDFNYDGAANGTDFSLLSSNFNQRSNAAAAVLPVISAPASTSEVVTGTANAAPASAQVAAVQPVVSTTPGNTSADQTDSVSTVVLDPVNKNGHKRIQTPRHHRA